MLRGLCNLLNLRPTTAYVLFSRSDCLNYVMKVERIIVASFCFRKFEEGKNLKSVSVKLNVVLRHQRLFCGNNRKEGTMEALCGRK